MEKSISPERALELVLECVPEPAAEICSLRDAAGRVLAESVVVAADVPAFPRAMMDGVAVRDLDAGATVEVEGEVAAGHPSRGTVELGKCLEIMTGAPCPEGCEAVVPVEKTARQGATVLLPHAVRHGQHIQARGQICREGSAILQAGARVTPLVVGVLASQGMTAVRVLARPRVAVISTGDELVDPAEPLAYGQIRDSNGPMLEAMAAALDVTEVLRTHVLDTEDSLNRTLQSIDRFHIVVLSGGVSMGKYDLVPRVIEAMGGQAIFHKVTQRPGKPLFLASGRNRLFFGLPGNPRATHFCFARYVAAAIRKWTGQSPVLPGDRGVLASRFESSSDRTDFVPMRAERDDTHGWILT